jgi:hypothetical protein
VRSLYFKIFSASFLITFLSAGIATSINMHVHFSLSGFMSGLLLEIFLSVCTCWFHSTVTLPPWFVTAEFGTCSVHVRTGAFCPVAPLVSCICWSVFVHSLYHAVLHILLLLILSSSSSSSNFSFLSSSREIFTYPGMY